MRKSPSAMRVWKAWLQKFPKLPHRNKSGGKTRNPHPSLAKALELEELELELEKLELEDDEPENSDIHPLQREIVSAYLFLCTLTLEQGRSIGSLTHEEILRAIRKALDHLCSHHHHTHHHQEEGNGTDACEATDSCADGDEANSSRNDSPTLVGPSTAGASRGSFPPVKKRSRASGDDDNGGNDNNDDGDADGDSIKRRRPNAGPYWACPFFWFDTELYRDCLRLRFSRIVDVRAHIKRKHMQALHCPVCMSQFDKTIDKEAHIREISCLPTGRESPPGATPDMWDRIERSAKDKRTTTPRVKWYAMWDILFPDRVHPQQQPREPYAPTSELTYALDAYLRSFMLRDPFGRHLQQTYGPQACEQWATRFRDFVEDLERGRQPGRAAPRVSLGATRPHAAPPESTAATEPSRNLGHTPIPTGATAPPAPLAPPTIAIQPPQPQLFSPQMGDALDPTFPPPFGTTPSFTGPMDGLAPMDPQRQPFLQQPGYIDPILFAAWSYHLQNPSFNPYYQQGPQ